jgi:WD repeat and SOF domain-containing protein 1
MAYANLRQEKIKAALLAKQAQQAQLAAATTGAGAVGDVLNVEIKDDDDDEGDKTDLDWSTVMKRTFEAYIRGERPNMYGEWLVW